ncbi:ArsR/SmtB family transcription factor [Desulfovermiculus halophilus]|jgi:ArsR family transcriptional regulator|uniref:ArsR/SmtB family transcription factor n=1 Tax=Desulfovermiculus halophilus TaxID=339722 RepID=UPI0009FC8D5C|nr:metalloregulator ArsR/SmtB family transcription factor [Desulfovermiculus halophilus]
MNQDIRDRYEARARIMKALGHPSRLFIVDELSRQDRCVCELTEMIGADISTVSKHLSILREAGIVDYEKKGTQMHYRLAAPCVLGFFRCLEDMVRTNVQRQLHCLQDEAERLGNAQCIDDCQRH